MNSLAAHVLLHQTAGHRPLRRLRTIHRARPSCPSCYRELCYPFRTTHTAG